MNYELLYVLNKFLIKRKAKKQLNNNNSCCVIKSCDIINTLTQFVSYSVKPNKAFPVPNTADDKNKVRIDPIPVN